MKNGAIQLGFYLLVASALVHGEDAASKLNFDSVHVGEIVRRELSIPNTTGKPLTVKEVNTSCSCLRVVSVSRAIVPNSTGTLTLEYKPLRPGKAEIEVLVALDQPNVPAMEFRWTGEILPMVVPASKRLSEANDVLVSAKDLANGLAARDGMLIDIREAAKFHLAHIEGAANWPIAILRTFTSLKAKPIVLTGSGSDDSAIVQAALELREAGFQSVNVLRGGVRGWFIANPTESHPDLSASIALVTATEFLSSVQDEWLVIQLQRDLLDSPKFGKVPGAIPAVPGPTYAKALIKEIRQAQLSRPRLSKVLITSDDGSSYEEAESGLPEGLPIPLFYLKGGVMAYREAVAQEIAQRNQRTAKISTSGFVRGNPEAKVFRSGCATCPK